MRWLGDEQRSDSVQAREFSGCLLRRRARELLARKLSFLLGSLALRGQVSSHFGEPCDRAVLVLERGDNDVCPETRAVLAQAPALILEAAHAAHGLENSC